MNNEKLDKISQEMKLKKIVAVKEITKMTFEQIADAEKIRNGLQERIKVLKHDLFDLKDGRLDRILERQGMNEECKGISVFTISKKTLNGEGNPWYIDYSVTYMVEGTSISIELNNSLSKMHSSGSYKLKDGSIRYL